MGNYWKLYLTIDKYPGCVLDLSGECLLRGFSLGKLSKLSEKKPSVDCILGDLWNASKVWPLASCNYFVIININISITMIIVSLSLSNIYY